MRADRLAERTADYGAHHPVVDEFAAAEPEATGDELEALRRTFRNGGAPVSLLIVRQAWLELRQERETPRRRRR
jgi:hypothetical protein